MFFKFSFTGQIDDGNDNFAWKILCPMAWTVLVMTFLQQRLKSFHQDLANRPDGPLGNDWLVRNWLGGDSSKVPVIFSNGIRMAPATGFNDEFEGIAVFKSSMLSDNCRIELPCAVPNTEFYGGAILRCSEDLASYVLFASSEDNVAIQYRINGGGYSSVKSSANGNFFTTGDILVAEASGQIYQIKRIRGGSETILIGWNDSSGEYPRTSDRSRAGLFGTTERGFSGDAEFSLWFTQASAWNI